MAGDLTLNDGWAMPQLGMGVFKVPESQTAMIVRTGLDVGFRLVDTAAVYNNERGVGDALEDSGIWVTTKLWNDRHDDVEAALDESLALLGRDSVDLYLIHWPHPEEDRYVAAWQAMVALREAGKTRSIGVSNFLPEHLERIVAATKVTPAVNQIELHPRFQQRDLVAWHRDHGIVTQAWSPLGHGGLLDDPAIVAIADRHSRSAAQVVIAWHLAKGNAVIPKGSSREHLTDNFAGQDLALSDDEIAAIDALDDPDGRTGPDPLTF